MKTLGSALRALLALTASALAIGAQAQAWPTQSVRIIVPFPRALAWTPSQGLWARA